MKTCYSCQIEKSLSEFHKDSSRKDGAQRACKACISIIDKIRRSKNKEAIKARFAIYKEANREKIAAKQKEYRLRNKETQREKNVKNYAENKDALLAVNAKYRAENPEREKARNAKWAKANPEKCAAKTRRRRALKLKAEGSHTKQDIERLFFLQKGKCASCTTKLIKSGKNIYHVDHIMPLTKGGGDGPENLQLLCPGCNIKKNAKDPLDWAKENGKLL
jgi:5-methylcytosine-specific restriction endonuclease McrA